MANVAAFHCQHAAEKLLKAVIAAGGVEPPRVHDLSELAELAVESKPDVRPLAADVESISSWAVLTRYPSHGDTPPPTVAEISVALSLVQRLRTLATEAAADR
jgi:HEPN domain-containing protein